jgi:hypothetical protein
MPREAGVTGDEFRMRCSRKIVGSSVSFHPYDFSSELAAGGAFWDSFSEEVDELVGNAIFNRLTSPRSHFRGICLMVGGNAELRINYEISQEKTV